MPATIKATAKKAKIPAPINIFFAVPPDPVSGGIAIRGVAAGAVTGAEGTGLGAGAEPGGVSGVGATVAGAGAATGIAGAGGVTGGRMGAGACPTDILPISLAIVRICVEYAGDVGSLRVGGRARGCD
jgi:hypothetical protein